MKTDNNSAGVNEHTREMSTNKKKGSFAIPVMTPVVDWLPALIESGRLQLDIKSFGELYQRVSNHKLLHDITDVYMLKSSAFFVVVFICFF